MSGPSRCADGRGMPVGPGANGSAGSVDLFVLFVCLFFVVDVGSRAEDRLHEVDAQRGAGSGAREELAAGVVPPQSARASADANPAGSLPPPSSRRTSGLHAAPACPRP